MLGIQNARCETSNKALEQRIENIESRLESTENTVEKTLSESGVLGKLSFGGLIAGAYQHQNVDDAPGFNNAGRGAFVFQPEIGFTLSEADEIFTKFGFAAGNALNDGTSPFTFTSWAADLEDDVKDINGRNRDYLLTAWYKHTFTFSEKNTLGITGGLVDATDYLDENAYANDGFTQCVILSFDQQLGGILGAWIRFGWQDDDAAIICKSLYSGGLDINGKLWRRELNEYFAITADLQYQDNNMKQGTCPSGFISGVRCVVEF